MTVLTLDQQLDRAMQRHQQWVQKQKGDPNIAADVQHQPCQEPPVNASSSAASVGKEAAAVSATAPTTATAASVPLQLAAGTAMLAATTSTQAKAMMDQQRHAESLPLPESALAAGLRHSSLRPSHPQPLLQLMQEQPLTHQHALPAHGIQIPGDSSEVHLHSTSTGQHSVNVSHGSSASYTGKRSEGSVQAAVQPVSVLVPLSKEGARTVQQLLDLSSQGGTTTSGGGSRSSCSAAGAAGAQQQPCYPSPLLSTAPAAPMVSATTTAPTVSTVPSIARALAVPSAPTASRIPTGAASAHAGAATGRIVAPCGVLSAPTMLDTLVAADQGAHASASGKVLQALAKGQQAKKRSSGGKALQCAPGGRQATWTGSNSSGGSHKADRSYAAVKPHHVYVIDQNQHQAQATQGSSSIGGGQQAELPYTVSVTEHTAVHESYLQQLQDRCGNKRSVPDVHPAPYQQQHFLQTHHCHHPHGDEIRHYDQYAADGSSEYTGQQAPVHAVHVLPPAQISLCEDHLKRCEEFDSTFHANLPTALRPGSPYRSDGLIDPHSVTNVIDPYSFIWDEEEDVPVCQMSAVHHHTCNQIPAVHSHTSCHIPAVHSQAHCRLDVGGQSQRQSSGIQEVCTSSRPSAVRLAQLVEELACSQQACQAVAAEQQVLVVERSATIMHVQIKGNPVVQKVEVARDNQGGGPGGVQHIQAVEDLQDRLQAILAAISAEPVKAQRQSNGLHATSAEHTASCRAAEQRLASLCQSLPADSSIRTLMTSSELLPCLKELLGAVQSSQTRWLSHTTSLKQGNQHIQQQLEQAIKELDAARSSVRSAQEQLAASGQQQQDLQQQLQVLTQQQQSQQQRAGDEAMQLRQRALAAEEHAAELERQLQDMRANLQQQTVELAAAAQAAKDEGLQVLRQAEAQAEHKLQQQAAEHQLQVLNLQAELQTTRTAVDNAQAALAKQEHEYKERAEIAHNVHMQAARLNDKLTQQVTSLKEQKLQLQVVVAAAEEQLKGLCSDVDRVRSRQPVPSSPRSPSHRPPTSCGCSSPQHHHTGSPRADGLWIPPGVYHEPSFSSRPCSPPARVAVNPHLRLQSAGARVRHGAAKRQSWRPS